MRSADICYSSCCAYLKGLKISGFVSPVCLASVRPAFGLYYLLIVALTYVLSQGPGCWISLSLPAAGMRRALCDMRAATDYKLLVCTCLERAHGVRLIKPALPTILCLGLQKVYKPYSICCQLKTPVS